MNFEKTSLFEYSIINIRLDLLVVLYVNIKVKDKNT